MACAAFSEKRQHRVLGLSGITLSIAAASLTILGMWMEIDSEVFWKSTLTLGVLAAAFAHGFLLLLPRLTDRQRWVQALALFCIGVLAIQIVVAAWGEIEEESYYRTLAVVAILVGLGIFGVLGLNFLGLGLGVAGIVQPDRSRVVAILGLVFNALVILGLCGLMALGMTMAA